MRMKLACSAIKLQDCLKKCLPMRLEYRMKQNNCILKAVDWAWEGSSRESLASNNTRNARAGNDLIFFHYFLFLIFTVFDAIIAQTECLDEESMSFVVSLRSSHRIFAAQTRHVGFVLANLPLLLVSGRCSGRIQLSRNFIDLETPSVDASKVAMAKNFLEPLFHYCGKIAGRKHCSYQAGNAC